MSRPVRILVALLAGLFGGILLARAGTQAAGVGVAIAQPVGAAWLNAL